MVVERNLYEVSFIATLHMAVCFVIFMLDLKKKTMLPTFII